ncbi:MAG: hypothetical protein H6807_12960 [Planctomycetes bacterium]|nr:hypothetical protein [Planctomycetota bacterium]
MRVPRRALALLLILALGLGLCRQGCRLVARHETRRILETTRAGVLAAAGELPAATRERLRAGLDQALSLAADDRLSPIARDTLRNRGEAVLADGRLFPREADHLLRLLDALPTWRDEVQAIEFMGQR